MFCLKKKKDLRALLKILHFFICVSDLMSCKTCKAFGDTVVTVASQQAVSGFEPVGFFVEFICYVYV